MRVMRRRLSRCEGVKEKGKCRKVGYKRELPQAREGVEVLLVVRMVLELNRMAGGAMAPGLVEPSSLKRLGPMGEMAEAGGGLDGLEWNG